MPTLTAYDELSFDDAILTNDAILSLMTAKEAGVGIDLMRAPVFFEVALDFSECNSDPDAVFSLVTSKIMDTLTNSGVVYSDVLNIVLAISRSRNCSTTGASIYSLSQWVDVVLTDDEVSL